MNDIDEFRVYIVDDYVKITFGNRMPDDDLNRKTEIGMDKDIAIRLARTIRALTKYKTIVGKLGGEP